MRTTLDLDDDILNAAKELAVARGTTAGRVISDLARRGLAQSSPSGAVRNGVPLLPPRAAGEPRVTMKRVNELRDPALPDDRE
jgi:hypothetical protein